MTGKTIEQNAADALFRLFNSSQDLQKRIYRMIARGHFNELSVNELRSVVKGMTADLEDLDELVAQPIKDSNQ